MVEILALALGILLEKLHGECTDGIVHEHARGPDKTQTASNTCVKTSVVGYVGNNHYRFEEDPKPPDGTRTNLEENMKLEDEASKSEGDGSEADMVEEEEEAEMVRDTPMGAINLNGRRCLCELISRHHPDIIFVMETDVPFSRTRGFWNHVQYEPVALVEERGYSGGLWCLKKVALGV
ncbi:hypothetical protein RJT34_30400 [Clitoria ternatea]|uniref:Uncharacterized protein n=1 Tax=Clitoria ternatea TaxID=43366 RepID=A0AAN9ETD3_CLITE